MRGTGPRWEDRSAERRTTIILAAGAVVVVALSVLLWWLLFTDRGMLLRVAIAGGVIMLIVDVAVRVRRRLRVRRQRREAREDWPHAATREQGGRLERSLD